jgi:hypothetical protein
VRFDLPDDITLTLDEARQVLAALIDSQRTTPNDSMLWVQQMDAIRTLDAKLAPDGVRVRTYHDVDGQDLRRPA